MSLREEYVADIAFNPSQEAIYEIPSIPPPHLSINYEDEEELNSWIWRFSCMQASYIIWRSIRIPRKFVASDKVRQTHNTTKETDMMKLPDQSIKYK